MVNANFILLKQFCSYQEKRYNSADNIITLTGKDLGSLLTSYIRNRHQSWDT